MAHVFISYSCKDTDFVEELDKYLRQHHIATWLDTTNIGGSQDWHDALENGLEDAFAVIFVATPDSIQSRWVRREQLYSDQIGKPRVAVMPIACRLPLHASDLTPYRCHPEDYSPCFDGLLGEVQQLQDNGIPARAIQLGNGANKTVAAYLNLLLAEANADLRDALYVNLIGVPEAGKTAPKGQSSPLSFGLDDMFGDFDRLDLEQLQGEAFDQRGKDIPDARIPLREMQRVILLGEPGSGKTTTLLQLAVDLAREAQKESDKLPVFIPLRQFDGSKSFEEFVKAQMYTLQNQYERLLAQDRLILLLDALNEMPRKSADGRELVTEIRDYLRDKQDWIVSCRVRDYQEELSSLANLGKVRLKPLDPPRIYEVIQKRFAQLAQEYPDKVQSDEGEKLWRAMYGSNDLLRAWWQFVGDGVPDAFWEQDRSEYTWYDWAVREMHEDKRRILPLCRNPYMTNMVCRLYVISKSLPDNRGALFAQFVDKLLEREKVSAQSIGAKWLDDKFIRKGLAYIAYEMGAKTEMPYSKAQSILQEHLPDIDLTLLLRLAVSASLLDVGEDVRFTHQLLQEYFASEVLGAEIDSNVDPKKYWKPENWWKANGREETLIILAGVREDPEAVAQWVAPAQPLLAYQVLTESGISLDLETIVPATRKAFAESVKIKTGPSVHRAKVYRILEYMNADIRKGVGTTSMLSASGEVLQIPDIEWCKVPAGEFWYGYGDKKEICRIDCDYAISKYPITNAQFQTFIEASDGYNNPQWWTKVGLEEKGKRTAPDEHDNPDFRLPNHPRIYIRWYEAYAFTRWLGAKLGNEVRLPTEYEWEKAARGTDGRIYPYGNQFDASKVNTSETGIRQTSTAGVFPDGASPFGVLDMSGNVWEWCLTEYSNPQQDASCEDINSNSYRVLCGGSWYRSYYFSQIASRSYGLPNVRNNHFGFRIVRLK